MKKLILFVILLGFTQNISAHNPANASYYLFQQKDQWQLRVEFAWSLRNALNESFPYLKEDKLTDDDYKDCVMDYLNMNLDIIVDGKLLEFVNIKQIPGDHGHSYVFLMHSHGAN